MRFTSEEQNTILDNWNKPWFRRQTVREFEGAMWRPFHEQPKKPGRYMVCVATVPETTMVANWDGEKWDTWCTHWRELPRGPVQGD